MVSHVKVKFDSLTGRQKILLGIVAAIGIFSCALAWRDLARRGAHDVRGPKLLWRIILTLNPGNSLLYWLLGRK
jgi:hypothetical protein